MRGIDDTLLSAARIRERCSRGRKGFVPFQKAETTRPNGGSRALPKAVDSHITPAAVSPLSAAPQVPASSRAQALRQYLSKAGRNDGLEHFLLPSALAPKCQQPSCVICRGSMRHMLIASMFCISACSGAQRAETIRACGATHGKSIATSGRQPYSRHNQTRSRDISTGIAALERNGDPRLPGAPPPRPRERPRS